GRAMHLEQALECIDFAHPAPPEPAPPPAPFHAGAVVTRPVLRTEHFGLELM
ncbi:MAG: hypothetical protein GWO02_21145, partial [Gammaproteobacteria bacterium]|nr:hypothetical protein [Gammaproteobacteria bacterium]